MNEKHRLKLSYDIARNVVDMYRSLNIDFTLKVSSFTIEIESDFEKFYFYKNKRSNQFFIAGRMVEKDIKNSFPVVIDDNLLKYYDTGFITSHTPDTMYKVDITSCYPTILFNKGLISTKTYNYIHSLPKKERLASIGMLARRKVIFFYKNGEIYNFRVDRGNFGDYFFYCIQETYKIMRILKTIIGEDYLFSWADAIYFKTLDNAKVLQDELLNTFNLRSSFETLSNVTKEVKEGTFRIDYINEKLKRTYINIPFADSADRIINYILNLKDENINFQSPETSLGRILRTV